MKKCKLCLSNPADKRNSHIISKFLGKGLFSTTSHRHSIEISPTGTYRKVQDTIKEDHLFCSSCEKRMEILETYFSKKLEEVLSYQDYPEKFETLSIHGQDYLNALELQPFSYYLFFYLQSWRISISTSRNYVNYTLPYEAENEIRKYLDANLKQSYKDMIAHFKIKVPPPRFINCFVIPKEINEGTRGIYTAYEFSKGSFLIIALNFAFMLFTEKNNIQAAYRLFDNSNTDCIKIFLSKNETWKNFNNLIIDGRIK